MMQTFLSPLNKFSQNPGYESFSLVFDEGYSNNVNLRDALELDIETCDLLRVIISSRFFFLFEKK